MIDQRPQYGEFATPEEQRRLAGLPPLDAVINTPAEPVQVAAPDAAPAKPRRWDRIITIALLAYGLINVFTAGMSYLDLPTVMNESMKILGVPGEFTNFEQGKLWGMIAAVLLVIGWVITAWLSVRRLRKGKLTWWLPIVGAAVTMLVVGVCITVPMMGDPAFISYIEGMSG
ncbi:MAG: DUF6264 family protein [Microbacterium sp.]|uniref:DUF6264 family protein n=1 Tax=Microbacterium sp. TaxID=51671 RepID=UPI003F9A0F2B